MRLAKGTPQWIFLPWLDVLIFLSIYYLAFDHPLVLVIAGLSALLALFLLFFFRDPERPIAEGLVSAADGMVLEVEQEGDRLRLAVFMSPFNVHVNRAPIAGKVISQDHRPGGYTAANKPESRYNEQLETMLETELGHVRVTQIAGAMVRRIVTYVEPGQTLARGERLGLVRFGSRVDIELPAKGVEVLVRPGQKVKAGSTSLARLPTGPND